VEPLCPGTSTVSVVPAFDRLHLASTASLTETVAKSKPIFVYTIDRNSSALPVSGPAEVNFTLVNQAGQGQYRISARPAGAQAKTVASGSSDAIYGPPFRYAFTRTTTFIGWYGGDAGYLPGSAKVTVQMRPSISRCASTSGRCPTGFISFGRHDRPLLQGCLAPTHSGAAVTFEVQKRVGTHWKAFSTHRVKTTPLGHTRWGRAKLLLAAPFHHGAIYRYRLVFKGDAWAAPGTSSWQRVRYV